MSKPSLKLLIIICSIILSVLLIILAFQLQKDDKLKNYYISLHDADKLIESSFYNQAESDLEKLYPVIYDSRTALMFLKRLNRISASRNSYTVLEKYAEMLYGRFSRNIEIASVYAYALQKNGKYEKSYEVSDSRLKKSVYYPIHLLNHINTDSSSDSSEIPQKYKGNYNFIFSDTKSPEDKESLLAAFDDFNDKRFLLDAALYSAVNSSTSEALELLERTGENSFTDVKAILAYDQQNYKKARDYLDASRPDISDEIMYLTAADIMIRSNSISEAEEIYSEFLEKYPEKYSIPYRNMYSLNYSSSARHQWLSEGLKYFPNDNNLLVPTAWEMQMNNDYASMMQTVSYFRENEEAGDLFNISLLISGRSPEHVIGNFWNIYNTNPDSEVIAVSFANYLLKCRQFDQLELLLNRYSETNGDSYWLLTYSAINFAMKNNYEEALSSIEKAAVQSKSAENYYNTGVIQMLSGDLASAEESFLKAAEEAEDNAVENKIIFKIYLKLAETNYRIGDDSDADFYSGKYTVIDPDNLEGSILNSKIQERKYD